MHSIKITQNEAQMNQEYKAHISFGGAAHDVFCPATPAEINAANTGKNNAKRQNQQRI